MASPGSVEKRDQTTDTILDLELSLFSQGQIRVAVVPVGNVPDEVFRMFMEQLHQYSHVKLKDVRANYDAMSDKNPFKSQPWNTGAMHFKFMHEDTVSMSSVAHLDGCRAIMAVIGIFHCDNMPDVRRAEEELLRKRLLYQKARPTAQQPEMPHRLFGFEPSDFGEGGKDDTAETIVPFKRLNGQLQVDPAFFTFIMHDFAGCMLVNLAGLATYQNWKEFQLDHYPDRAFQGGGALEMPRNSQDIIKRKWLRYYKRLGDLCLLAAAPADAVLHYNSALETGKALSDLVMVGSAHEGLAAATVLDAALRVGSGTQTHGLDRYDRSSFKYRLESLNSRDEDVDSEHAASSVHSSTLNRESSSNAMMAMLDEDEVMRMEILGRVASDGFAGTLALWEELRSKANMTDIKAHLSEARTCYKKKGAYPCLAALELKWARFLAGISLGGSRHEVTQAAMEAAGYLPLLSVPMDQQLVLADAANVCGMVGAARKRALLLAELTQLMSRNNWRSPAVALHALCGLQLFQCSKPARDLYKPWLSDARITDEMIYAMTQHSTVPVEGWKWAFMDMLKNIANVAITNGLWVEAWQAASLLLRHFGLDLTKYQQEEMTTVLEKLSGKLNGYPMWMGVRITGPPPLVKFCDFLPFPPHLRAIVVDRRANGAGKDDTFKYKVVQASRKEVLPDEDPQEVWVEGEDSQVSVYILNPCSDSIISVTMSLAYEHLDLDGHKTDSRDLPADAKPSVVLSREFKVVVPAALNLRDRSLQEFQNKGKMSMKARPLIAGKLHLPGVMLNRGVVYFQPWTRTMPGEVEGSRGLPSAQSRSEQVRRKSEAILRRVGIAAYHKSPEPPRPEVVVVPAQPLLVASFPGLSSAPDTSRPPPPSARQSGELAATVSGNVKAQAANSSVDINMFEGQCSTLQLQLENVSKADVHGVLIDLETDVQTERTLTVLSGYGLGSFTGVHATVDRSPLDHQPPTLAKQQRSSVSLRLTAGSQPRSAAKHTYTVAIRVSYWSDDCQPKPGLVTALTNPQTQAIGRQFCVSLNVTVLPLITITSVSCTEPQSYAPKARLGALTASSASNDADSPALMRNASGSASCSDSTALSVGVQRTGRALRCMLCMCETSVLERLLVGRDTPGGGGRDAFTELCASAHVKLFSEVTPSCDLMLVLPKFDTRGMYTIARSNKPRARKSLAEQLRAAARHFSGSVVVVWRLDAADDELSSDPGTNPDGIASLGFITLPEQMLMERPKPPLQGLPAMLRMPLTCTVFALTKQPSGDLNYDTPPIGSIQAMALQPVLLQADIESWLPNAHWVKYTWRVTRIEEGAERASDSSLKRTVATLPRKSGAVQEDWLARPMMRTSISRSRSNAVADAKYAVDGGWSPRIRPTAHADARSALSALALHDPNDQALDAAFFPNGILGGNVCMRPSANGHRPVDTPDAETMISACMQSARVELNGVFSKAGLYEAHVVIDSVWEDSTGQELNAEDHASSSIILLRVFE